MTALVCLFCERPLQRATVFVGIHPVGPKCARMHNVTGAGKVKAKAIKAGPRKPAQPKTSRDALTLDLFGETLSNQADNAINVDGKITLQQNGVGTVL